MDACDDNNNRLLLTRYSILSWIDPLGAWRRLVLGAWELWSIAIAQVSRLASSLVFFRSPGRFPLLLSLPKKKGDQPVVPVVSGGGGRCQQHRGGHCPCSNQTKVLALLTWPASPTLPGTVNEKRSPPPVKACRVPGPTQPPHPEKETKRGKLEGDDLLEPPS